MDRYGRSLGIRLQRLVEDEPTPKKRKQAPEDELEAIKKQWRALQSVATGDISAESESDRLWEAWLEKVVKFELEHEDF